MDLNKKYAIIILIIFLGIDKEDESEMTIGTNSTVRARDIQNESAVTNSMSVGDSILNTESVTTITDIARKSLKINSISTIATEKSAKIISELEELERQRVEDGKNDTVESRIEELQNELLQFMN